MSSLDRDDPTATVQAVADLFANLDAAFSAALRCRGFSMETMLLVFQAIEDCGTFIKQQMGIALPNQMFEVRLVEEDDKDR